MFFISFGNALYFDFKKFVSSAKILPRAHVGAILYQVIK